MESFLLKPILRKINGLQSNLVPKMKDICFIWNLEMLQIAPGSANKTKENSFNSLISAFALLLGPVI